MRKKKLWKKHCALGMAIVLAENYQHPLESLKQK